MYLQNINVQRVERKFVVNEKNFTEAVYLFLLGYKHSDYNYECFSSMEVSRFLAIQEATDKMIENIIIAGYCPYKLVQPIERLLGINLGIYPIPTLKQKLDSRFQIEIEGNVMKFGYAYYRSNKEECAC